MLLELDALRDNLTGRFTDYPLQQWSVLVPFFNEAALIGATIAGLAQQSDRARIILIDNGSTDNSAAVAKAACERLSVDYLLIEERRPGKVSALAAGLRRVTTRYVATCDADTIYPPHYLAEARALLERGDCVVAGAHFVADAALPAEIAASGRSMCGLAKRLPRQCHTGGAGQSFRTDSLRRAGGFDADRWGYVLEDHEIIHRVMKLGTMQYSEALWCMPSPRERDRDSIRWTLTERLLYTATAPWAGDWFFYSFLGGRLRARRLSSERIRERAFQPIAHNDDHATGRTIGAAAYSMCG